MEILKRLAFVIHWIGFIIGVISFLLISFAPDGDGNILGLTKLLLGIFFLILYTGIGWLIRYVISGMIHFLPWKN